MKRAINSATSRTTGNSSPSRKPGSSTADSDVYLYNTETKEMKNITPHQGDVATEPAAFDPKSKYLYFLSNEGGEFMYVARYDLNEGKREVVEKTAVGRFVVLLLAQRQISRRRHERRRADEDQDLRGSTGKLVPLPPLPEGDISGVNISRERNEDGLLSRWRRVRRRTFSFTISPRRS